MSLSKPLLTVKDSVTFVLNEADLTDKKVGEALKTAERDVPYSDGLKWWVAWYPAGQTDEAKNHVSMYLHVNKTVSAKYSFKVACSSIEHFVTHDFLKPQKNIPSSQDSQADKAVEFRRFCADNAVFTTGPRVSVHYVVDDDDNILEPGVPENSTW
uniref:MATH domain-containing protein n=1 Tax=Panagrellus redivivus TaxID=6233 RepID=A0A7E4VJ37_PANRE